MNKRIFTLLALILLLILQTTPAFAGGEEKCFTGDEEVPCSNSGDSVAGTGSDGNWVADTEGSWRRDILSENFMADERNDPLFVGFFALVIATLVGLAYSRKRVFRKTLIEYVKPIKYYLIAAFLVACSQYVLLEMNRSYGILTLGQFSLALRASQALWAMAVALAVVRVVQKEKFGFMQVLVVGLLFDAAIMVTKVSIRYFLYGRTIFYVADRLLYGTALIMLIVLLIWGFFSLAGKIGLEIPEIK